MAAFDKDNVPKVDVRTELAAFGFVNQIQKSLPTTNAYFNIPSAIILYVAAYFGNIEEFEIRGRGKFVISDDKRTATVTGGESWSSAYGAIQIPSNSNIHCLWKIKLSKLDNAFFVAIASKRDTTQDFQYNSNDPFYCLYGNTSILESRQLGTDGPFTDIGAKTNDIITMELNLKTRKIKWMINDQPCGTRSILENDANVSFYLAVSAFTCNDSLTIMEFKYL